MLAPPRELYGSLDEMLVPEALSRIEGRTVTGVRQQPFTSPYGGVSGNLFLSIETVAGDGQGRAYIVKRTAPAWDIIMQGTLDADPIAQIENELGLTALILLVASLACTPARWLFGWTWPQRIRRDLGLLAFFYAMLHFLLYLVLDQTFDWQAIYQDIIERPFITVGFLALVLMVPLALTSTSGSVRRLGFRRWTRLHQLAYVAGVLAAIHFIMP